MNGGCVMLKLLSVNNIKDGIDRTPLIGGTINVADKLLSLINHDDLKEGVHKTIGYGKWKFFDSYNCLTRFVISNGLLNGTYYDNALAVYTEVYDSSYFKHSWRNPLPCCTALESIIDGDTSIQKYVRVNAVRIVELHLARNEYELYSCLESHFDNYSSSVFEGYCKEYFGDDYSFENKTKVISKAV
jgi:hypothetical protein